MIPDSEHQWLVVIRKVRDSTSRGQIVYRGMTQRHAQMVARELGGRMPAWNVWAIRVTEY